VDSIWDSGGTDVLDANGRRAGVTLDLRQGAFSSFDADQDVVVTFGTEIENAFGAQGADRVIGNELNNLLRGHANHDVLAGKAGRDRMEGGAGRDTLWGDEGVDLLFGGRGQDQLYGGSENDQLTGRNGADRLDGQAGDDLLLGGRGLDTFVFKHQGGNDTVQDFSTDADRLDIIGHGGLDALLDQAQDTGNGVLFDFDQGGSLLLRDVTLAGLGEDFLI
jgi:Ca2+-binding RTX toxin-like protein